MKLSLVTAVLILPLLGSCASWLTNAGNHITDGSIQRLATPSASVAIAGAASAAGSSAASAAINQMSTPAAQGAVRGLSSSAAAGVLTKDNHDYLVGLVGDIRDEATGPKFQENLNAAIDGAQPHVNALLQNAALQVKTDADTELPKLEKVLYIVLAVIGSGIVLVLLVTALLVHETRKSRRMK